MSSYALETAVAVRDALAMVVETLKVNFTEAGKKQIIAAYEESVAKVVIMQHEEASDLAKEVAAEKETLKSRPDLLDEEGNFVFADGTYLLGRPSKS